jgi:hypothetical protein
LQLIQWSREGSYDLFHLHASRTLDQHDIALAYDLAQMSGGLLIILHHKDISLCHATGQSFLADDTAA